MPLSRRTHSTEKRTRHEITRHGHTRRTSTGATQPALDHSGACEHAASCGDGGRSGCSRLTSGAAKSLDISTHLPGRGRGGSTQRSRAAGAGPVCGTAAHHREALSARSRVLQDALVRPCHSCIWASRRARGLRAPSRLTDARTSERVSLTVSNMLTQKLTQFVLG